MKDEILFEDDSNRDDGFMKVSDMITDFPYKDAEEKEETPWYKDMLGNYIFNFKFGHYKMQNVQREAGPFVWNELNWFLLDLDVKKGEALFLADKCVALDYFYGKGEVLGNEGISVWEKSDVREFLNNRFYEEAFNEEEKELILTRNKYNDKVFILNREEIEEKFGYEDLRPGEVYYADDISGRIEVWLEPVSWWVDTEGEQDGYMCVVSENGDIDTSGREMDADETGIRPALWIDLRKLIEYRKYKKGMVFAKLIEEY